jgi:two-component system, NtrC family, sensor histidine kinase KinB
MKIKNKIRRSFGIIFIIVLFFGALSGFFINQIANSAKVILQNNYQTLGFTHDMRSVLDTSNLPLSEKAGDNFDRHLKGLEHHISGKKEIEMTAMIRSAFTILQSPSMPLVQQGAAETEVRSYLHALEVLNMNAIEEKTADIKSNSDMALLVTGVAGLVTLLLLVAFGINLSRQAGLAVPQSHTAEI